MIKIIHCGQTFDLKNRGIVYYVNVNHNNLPNTRKEFKTLIGQEVEIDGIVYKIKGVESFALAEDVVQNTIGILV